MHSDLPIGPRGPRRERSDKRSPVVYGLIDPRSNELRYVGCCFDPKRRLLGHMSTARSLHKVPADRVLPKDAWLAELAREKLTPKVQILETFPPTSLLPYYDEQRWIIRLRKRGFDLLNAKKTRNFKSRWTVRSTSGWLSCDGRVHHDAGQHLSVSRPPQRHRCAGVA